MLFKRRRERNREKQKVKIKKGHRNYIKTKTKTIGTKLITNTKKLKLKILSRVWNFKNTMLKKRRKKKKKGQKLLKKIYICMKFALKKIGSSFFFCKVFGYKSGN